MTTFRDREGNELELKEWAMKYEDREYRRVRLTTCPGPIVVSTIWTGFDSSVTEPQHLFETAVLKDGEVISMERWYTEDEAVKGHLRIVEENGGQVDVSV